MATTVSDRSTPDSPEAQGGPERRRWPSPRELFTIHRDGPVTAKERRRSAIGGIVAAAALALGVGVLHLVDGSGEVDVLTFVVMAVMIAVLGYAFPRFTTTPGLAMMSRHPDRHTTGGKVALIVFGLLLYVVAVVKIYY